MSGEGQFVMSKDGTKIWADAAGCHGKPAVVFIHEFCAFDKQFEDPELLENLYPVCVILPSNFELDLT
jgi:hypothetical protein